MSDIPESRAGESGAAPPGRATAVSVDLTTEIRWFVDGDVPSALYSWFVRGGAGLAETRCDAYRLGRRPDIGVKRRSGTTLELKRRIGLPEPFRFDGGPTGQLERWRRWSPADGRLPHEPVETWLDVEKTVVKRRFTLTGREVALSEATRAMAGDGCDVEVTSISTPASTAWSFAMAAFGQPEYRRPLLEEAWRGLAVEASAFDGLGLGQHNSCGYPAWLFDLGRDRGVAGE